VRRTCLTVVNAVRLRMKRRRAIFGAIVDIIQTFSRKNFPVFPHPALVDEKTQKTAENFGHSNLSAFLHRFGPRGFGSSFPSRLIQRPRPLRPNMESRAGLSADRRTRGGVFCKNGKKLFPRRCGVVYIALRDARPRTKGSCGGRSFTSPVFRLQHLWPLR